MATRDEITQQDYQAMAEFRYQIRRFFRTSEEILRDADLKPQQYQLMLALKGVPDGRAASVGEIAERLQIQHHSTVELVDRLAVRGYIRRKRGGEDRRQVLLELTPKGEKILKDAAIHHREILRSSGPALVGALRRIVNTAGKAQATRAAKL